MLDEASLKVSVNVLTKGNAGAELGFVEVEADFDRSKKVISGTVERALRRVPCTSLTVECDFDV